jgi:hypothetical protein
MRVYRYEDQDRGIIQGILFAWYHADEQHRENPAPNPEALICVEFYDGWIGVELVRLAGSQVTVSPRDGSTFPPEPWSAPGGMGSSGKSYWAFTIEEPKGPC